MKTPNIPKSGGPQETVLRSNSGTIDRTIPMSNPGIAAFNAPTPNLSVAEAPIKRQSSPGGKTLLLIGLVLFVVLASVGFIYFSSIKQITNNNPDVIATTRSNDATAFAATSTTQANNATAATQAIATATGLAQASATASVVAANPDPYPPSSGTLKLYDPLKDNSRGYGWDVKPTSFGTCSFIGGFYHAAPYDGYYHICAARNTNYGNFTYEVNLNILKGDCGAILFRGDASRLYYYIFLICQDGSYQFLLNTGGTGNPRILKSDISPAIHRGLNQSNKIAVVANGNTFDLYVNTSKIDSVMDSTYADGQIGVAAQYNSSSTEVVFWDAKAWVLP